VPVHEKRRGLPEAGSIPAALDIYRSEIRFYQEIAPVIGIRVPACYRAEANPDGTVLMLEDLSSWQPGADPARVAGLLAQLHATWSGRAQPRWPWLRPVGAAIDLVADLYDRTWPRLRSERALPAGVVSLGDQIAGNVARAEHSLSTAGPLTLAHGDASMQNMRTSPEGEIALLDWEDVSAAPGAGDLAWLLVSSVAPARWAEVTEAYGAIAGPVANGLAHALPSAAVQGLLSLSDAEDGSQAADAWAARLQSAASYLAAR
jgi:aminoglycoside phosphotransferase (APT) family kinase protein